MTDARLPLSRTQVLGFRRRSNALDGRLPAGATSFHTAAWAGLQDSMPRAALLSLHARVEGVGPTSWSDEMFEQVWGPRYSTYVVVREDRAVFTRGRLPDDAHRRAVAEDTASRLDEFLAGRTMTYREAGRGMGVQPNSLRYGAPTGSILLRWEGAGPPVVWTVPNPDVTPDAARRELVRRHLHVFGPGTPQGFADWAGVKLGSAEATFGALAEELTPVATPIGEAWLLTGDATSAANEQEPSDAVRLLPSGDAYYLLQGAERSLLLPDPDHRDRLWTSRVWPGAILAHGEIVGTWRRSGRKVTAEPFAPLSSKTRTEVEGEAASLPLPGIDRDIVVRWVS